MNVSVLTAAVLKVTADTIVKATSTSACPTPVSMEELARTISMATPVNVGLDGVVSL